MDRPEPPVMPLVRRVKARLAALYGDRLAGVYLYGSHARGDARPDSDVDVLVALHGEVQTWEELRTMWALPGLAEASGGYVSLRPVAADRLAGGDDAFAVSVREDVVAA